MNIRRFSTLIAVLTLAGRVYGYDYNFLKSSSLLKDLNLVLFPVSIDSSKDRVLVSERVPIDNVFLLTASGKTEQLVADKAYKPDVGSGAVMAFRLKEKGVLSGHFIVIGKNASAARWNPAIKVSSAPALSCVTYKPGYERSDLHFLQAAEAPLLYDAVWHAAQKTSKDHSCPADTTHHIIGMAGQKGECITLLEDALDCDGRATFGELFGTLTVLHGAQMETWLVFVGNSYDGGGLYTAFRYQGPSRPKPREIETLVVGGS